MADLGDIIGSLMSGVIRARRIADENTATLAEYYKSNPLLEGLSVPRIRISELTIELPLLIEDQTGGEIGVIGDSAKIASSVGSQLKSTLTKNNIIITNNRVFLQTFKEEVKSQISAIKKSGLPVMKETIARAVQVAFTNTLVKMGITLTNPQKKIIARDLRDNVSSGSVTKEPVSSTILTNVKTADVKEKGSPTSVVHLKLILKEEGLEWTTQVQEDGSATSTLTPE